MSADRASAAERITPVVWVVMLLMQIYVIGFVELGVPSAMDWSRSFSTSELRDSIRVSQTFQLRAAGFRRIDIHVAVPGGSVTGDVLFELHEVLPEGPSRVVYQQIVPARSVADAEAYGFEFPALEDSFNKRYRFDLVSLTTGTGKGLVLRVTEGQAYRGGTLLVDGRDLAADLLFETSAEYATALDRLRHQYGLGILSLLGALFLLLQFALWKLLRHVAGPTSG